MRRTTVAMLVASAIIGGWFLRVASEKLPGWDAVAVLAAMFLFNALTEVLYRQIDKTTHSAEYTASAGGDR